MRAVSVLTVLSLSAVSDPEALAASASSTNQKPCPGVVSCSLPPYRTWSSPMLKAQYCTKPIRPGKFTSQS